MKATIDLSDEQWSKLHFALWLSYGNDTHGVGEIWVELDKALGREYFHKIAHMRVDYEAD